MLEGKRLKIEAAVSARLFQSAQYIQGLYHTWVPGAQQIPMETKVEQHPAGGSGVGCFFSGGVDSFYTLLKNGALPEGHPDRLTHLVFVAGFDLPLTNHTLLRQTRASLDRVATASDCQLLEVQTNLRALSDPWLTWGFYHGAALASVGLACGSLFRKLLIPSSFALKGQIHPWGSHRNLIPSGPRNGLSISMTVGRLYAVRKLSIGSAIRILLCKTCGFVGRTTITGIIAGSVKNASGLCSLYTSVPASSTSPPLQNH